MKVYLDAGHGGKDSGAVGIGGRLEKDDCQRLTDITVKYLTQYGITVVVNTNPDETLVNVVNQANDEKVDIFISIHRNAFSDPNANGLEVWTCTNARDVTKRNANLIYNKLINVSPMRGRGVKESDFYVLKYTNSPAMLLEIGFITNENDNYLFDKYINSYALAIAQAVCGIFGINYQRKYTVQIGSYDTFDQAQTVLLDAKDKGFAGARII